jgi:putative ABC transport system permease protein
VAVATSLPFRHEWDQTAFTDILDHPTDPAHRPNARLRLVSPNFFSVMGMRIVAGRPFTVDDRTTSEPVAIVNQAWFRRFIPDLDPLRQRFLLFGAGQPLTVVGVAHDISYRDVTKDPEPAVFVPIAQNLRFHLTFVVTAPDGHPERLSRAIRSAIGHLDSHIAVDTELLSHAVNQALVWPKLGLLLMVTFGGAALGLASVGVFGVIAFVTTQRQNEMAVRLALGGTTGHIFGLVLVHAARLAVGGAAAGLLLAWWMGQMMKSYVYEVSAGNIVVLAGSTALVIAVALAATLPSARRAARTNPVTSLLR